MQSRVEISRLILSGVGHISLPLVARRESIDVRHEECGKLPHRPILQFGIFTHGGQALVRSVSKTNQQRTKRNAQNAHTKTARLGYRSNLRRSRSIHRNCAFFRILWSDQFDSSLSFRGNNGFVSTRCGQFTIFGFYFSWSRRHPWQFRSARLGAWI
jgi:hypothetical protein